MICGDHPVACFSFPALPTRYRMSPDLISVGSVTGSTRTPTNRRQAGEELPQCHTFPARDVVGLARHAVLQQSNVGPGHVTNIEQVTDRLQVSRSHTVGACCPGGTEPLDERRHDVQQ